MRVNIYNEELTGEVSVVSVTPDTGRTFFGVRVFLASSDELHHSPDDDDRSAVTFWVHKDESVAQELATALRKMTPRT